MKKKLSKFNLKNAEVLTENDLKKILGGGSGLCCGSPCRFAGCRTKADCNHGEECVQPLGGTGDD